MVIAIFKLHFKNTFCMSFLKHGNIIKCHGVAQMEPTRENKMEVETRKGSIEVELKDLGVSWG